MGIVNEVLNWDVMRKIPNSSTANNNLLLTNSDGQAINSGINIWNILRNITPATNNNILILNNNKPVDSGKSFSIETNELTQSTNVIPTNKTVFDALYKLELRQTLSYANLISNVNVPYISVYNNFNIYEFAQPLTFDNVNVMNGYSVILNNQLNPWDNGIFKVTTSNNRFIFTRRDDFNEPSVMLANRIIVVWDGDVNRNTIWITQTNVVTIGVSPVLFLKTNIIPTILSISSNTQNDLSISTSTSPQILNIPLVTNNNAGVLSSSDYVTFINSANNNIDSIKPLTLFTENNLMTINANGWIKDSNKKIVNVVNLVESDNIPTVNAVKQYVDTNTNTSILLSKQENLNDLQNKPLALSNLTGVNNTNTGNVLMSNGSTAIYTQLKTHVDDNYIETDYNNVNRLLSKQDYTSFINNLSALKPLTNYTNNNIILLDVNGGIKDSNKFIVDSVSGLWWNIPTEIAVKNYVDTNSLLVWQNLNDIINKPVALANLTGVNNTNFDKFLMWNGTTANYTQLKTHSDEVYIETDYNSVNRLLSKTDYTSFINNLNALKPLSTFTNNNFILSDIVGGIKDSSITFVNSITGVWSNIPTEWAVKAYVDNKTTLSTLTDVNVGNNGYVLMWNGTTATYTQLKTHTIDVYIGDDYNNINRLLTKEDYTTFINNLGALKPLTIFTDNNLLLSNVNGGMKDSGKSIITSITDNNGINIPTEGAVKTYVDAKTALSTLTGVTNGNSGYVLMWDGITATYMQLKTHQDEPYIETDYNNVNRLLSKEDYTSLKNN
jgi:hypothetical protein